MLLRGQQGHLGLSLGEHALQCRCFTNGLVALIGGHGAGLELAVVLPAQSGQRPSQLELLRLELNDRGRHVPQSQRQVRPLRRQFDEVASELRDAAGCRYLVGVREQSFLAQQRLSATGTGLKRLDGGLRGGRLGPEVVGLGRSDSYRRLSWCTSTASSVTS